MKKRNSHPKRALRSILLVLLLCAVGMTKSYAVDFDFSAVCSTGQTLYYRITNSTTHEVQLTYPNHYENSGIGGGVNYVFRYYWRNYDQPTGNIVIPYFVEYNGISYSVTSIRDHTFGNHENQSGWNTTYVYDPCTEITSIIIPSSVTTIGDDAFARCVGLTSVTIPTSVTTIGTNVCYGCSNLVTVNFNATNCSSVGTNTWSGCTKFTTLNLGNTVTRIPNYGFQGATKIASVTLPNSLTAIGSYGFDGCTALTTVTCGNASTLANVGNYSFQNCSKLANINLPNTITTIGSYAFAGCTKLKSTLSTQLLPNALETIGDYAFQNATTLVYIRIPSTLTSLGKYAFKGCTALNTVDYEATNCTYSGTQAEPPFFYCSGLSTVNVSDNVTQISDYCFKDCTSLTNLTLRNGLSEIGTYAFYCCMNISSLILPTSVTSIGSFAFGNAYDMQIANVESHNPIPPTIGEEAVFPAGQTIYVPYASLNDYELAEYWEDYFFEGMVYKSIPAHGTTSGWRFIASPLMASTDPTEIDDMIAETETNFDLYRFNQSAVAEWENYKKEGDHYHFNLENGRGYLYANTEDVNLVFKGEFNEDETKTVALTYDQGKDFAGWNLVGNPFPVSAYANKSYYRMNDDGNAIYPTTVSSTTAIAPCTGIMIKAEGTGETVTFSKTAPSGQTNNGILQIAVANANTRSNVAEDKVIVSFNEEDALAKFVFNKENAQLYIPQGDQHFAIISSESQGEMPVNFRTNENGQYTITVNPENVEMNYLHLIDNLTGANIDLLATPIYTFNANTNDYESRFKLMFVANGEDGPSTGSGTFAFYSDGNWIIANPSTGSGPATLQVIDTNGRILSSERINGCVSKAIEAAAGVYVLRLINGNDVKVQKIVVR